MYTAINFGSPADDDRFMKHNDIIIIDQDMPIVEGQRPVVLPLDLSAEMYMKEADKITLEYRRWLIEVANEYAPADQLRDQQ